ncbi:MAG: hypothetical protein H0W89_06240 [Candidatus Levybacteria bacterium]|nr:hypothetical protein [Candidatus Levybacteria bacterium]
MALVELSGLDLEQSQSTDSPFIVVLKEIAQPNTDAIAIIQELNELGVPQGIASNTLNLFTKHVRVSSGVNYYLYELLYNLL